MLWEPIVGYGENPYKVMLKATALIFFFCLTQSRRLFVQSRHLMFGVARTAMEVVILMPSVL